MSHIKGAGAAGVRHGAEKQTFLETCSLLPFGANTTVGLGTPR